MKSAPEKTMDVRYSPHPDAVQESSAAALRDSFLIEKLFEKDAFTVVLSDQDRMLAGGVVPLGTRDLLAEMRLPVPVSMEHREMGIFNLGGPGTVETDSGVHGLMPLDALYVGKGGKKLLFSSLDPSSPAKFYFNCVPAHTRYPDTRIAGGTMEPELRGSPENASMRKMYRYITPGRVAACQLEMGLTVLNPGSVWCTMPPHIHRHRMEVYCYFDLPPDDVLLHFMGKPGAARHMLVRSEQAVISPSWSIHTAVGTRNYSFIWGMCGEDGSAAKSEILPYEVLG